MITEVMLWCGTSAFDLPAPPRRLQVPASWIGLGCPGRGSARDSGATRSARSRTLLGRNPLQSADLEP